MASRCSNRVVTIGLAVAATRRAGRADPARRIARGPRRPRSAPPIGSARCSAKRRRSPRRRRRCSSSSARSRSSASSRPRSSTTVESNLRATQAKLAATNARAAALRNAADTERPEVEARLVQLYKLGRAGYWRLLLDLDNLQSIGRAYRTASAMTRLDRERVQQHERTLTALAAERKALEAQAKEIARLQDARRGRARGDRPGRGRADRARRVDRRAPRPERAAHRRARGGAAAAAGRRSRSSGTGGAGVTLPLRPFRGALPWPATGVVTGRFGRQSLGRFGTAISRNGIEISLAEGQVVRAVHEGTIAYAEPFTGYGNLVILDHGEGEYTLYGYLSTMYVATGDRLEAGEPIGTSGRSPSGNPALYFELRVDGKPVDPLQWLKR